MLRSTVGTWVNYATTALFYVVFARSFGATSHASAFITTFTIAIAIGGIFSGTAQSIYVPRLLSAGGGVLSAGIRRMAWLTLLALAVFAAFAAFAPVLAPVIAPTLDRPGVGLVALMRYAAVFGLCQVLVGQLAALAWARGARFVPATTPALPSIVASVPLLLNGHLSAPSLYALLTVGCLLQIVVLAVTSARGLRFTSEPLHDLGGVTVAWLGAFAVSQFIVPFEVLIAAHTSASGGAEFNYAYRALSVAQLLIVGGLAYAALPDWSDFARADARAALERSIARTLSLAGLALSLAAAIGLVASRPLVQLAFQRGSFTAHDTQVVSAILTAALVGFLAEGVMLVLSPALVADRRSRSAITIGVARTAAVIVLVAIFGLTGGLVGVAVGYSVANVLALTLLLVYVVRAGMLTRRQLRLAGSSALVALLTGAAGGVVLVLGAPPLAGAVIVAVVFAGAVASLRDCLPGIRVPAVVEAHGTMSAGPDDAGLGRRMRRGGGPLGILSRSYSPGAGHPSSVGVLRASVRSDPPAPPVTPTPSQVASPIMTLPRYSSLGFGRGSSIGGLVDRERWLAALLGLGAIPAGILVGLEPVAVLLAALACGVVALCTFVPMRHLPALLLVGTIAMPTLVLEGIGGSGQARLVVAVLVLALVRGLLAKPRLAVPGAFPFTIATAVGLTLATAVVALTRPAGEVGTTSELVRDLSFPFAAIVGLLGGVHARASGRTLAIPRTVAVITILASLASVDYWVWTKHGPLPISSNLFSYVQGATGFIGRSVFPFVTDAPNVQAAMFMMLAAFAAPPLLLAARRRDRVLALMLLVTALAAMLSTESRTGLVAALAGSVMYVGLVKRAGARRLPVVITLLVVAAIGGYVVSTFPSERLTGDTLQARVLIWQQAAKSIAGSPIIGHGYLYSSAGNFEEVALTGGAVSHTQSTHDDLLSVLVDGGIVGATVFVTILVLMLRCGLRALRDRRSIPVGIGYCCMLAVLVASGIDNTMSQSAAVETIEWMTFGIVVGMTPLALPREMRLPRRRFAL